MICKLCARNPRARLHRRGCPRPYNPKALKGLLYCGASITAEIQKGRWGRGNYVYYRCSSPKEKNCPQKYMREEKVDEMFSDALGELYIDDAIAQKICQQLKVSHVRHDAFLKKELRRLQSQHTEKSNHLSLIYEDRLNGVISIGQYKTHRQRIENELGQIQIAMERLNRVNFDYKEQGSTVLELLKGFKRIYSRQDYEGKAKILRIVLDRCILQGQDTAFFWNEPFGLLFTIGKLTRNTGVITGREWGGLGANFRTFLRHTSIAYQIRSLQSVA